MSDSMKLTVEFFGGLDALFSNQRKITLSLPAMDEKGKPANMNFLIRHLYEHHLTDHRKEFFVLDDTVRPGILVLINDADWELEGEGDYEMKKGDNIVFVSTLHGG